MGVSARPRHWAGSLIKTKREPLACCRISSSTTHCYWYTSFVFDLVLLWLLSPLVCFSSSWCLYMALLSISDRNNMTVWVRRSYMTRPEVHINSRKPCFIFLSRHNIVFCIMIKIWKDIVGCLWCKFLFCFVVLTVFDIQIFYKWNMQTKCMLCN